jgi:hypothetical protein
VITNPEFYDEAVEATTATPPAQDATTWHEIDRELSLARIRNYMRTIDDNLNRNR